MKNWFIINISGLEIAEGFYEFYFGTLTEQVHYFKARNSHKITFERLLHDRLAAELLKEQRPNYNLLFIVSTPIQVLEGMDEEERGLTPFITYLQEEIHQLTEFLGIGPVHTLVFEVCEHFESMAVFKKSSLDHLNNIHDLDHLKKDTKYYEVGNTWQAPLLTFLKNNVNQSNLEYLLQTHPLFYFRIPLKGKPRMKVLHQLFSFFQLIVNDKIDLNNTTLRKGRFQELSFSGNKIREKIPGLVTQIAASLSKLKLSNEKKEITATLNVLEEELEETQEHLDKIKALYSHWKINTAALNCQNAPAKLEEWRTVFQQYLSKVDAGVDDFLLFLHTPSHLIKTIPVEKNGALAFWQLEKTKLHRAQKQTKKQLQAFSFDKSKTIKELETAVGGHFEEIEKDLARCPNQAVLIVVLLVSLIFYVVASSTVLSAFYEHLIFIMMTAIYTIASLSLFRHFKNKSIRSIQAHLKKIEKIIQEKGQELQQVLLAKKENQQQLYALNNMNQNLQIIEQVFEQYGTLTQHISELENKTTDISTIGPKRGKASNYRFSDHITTAPKQLGDYLKIYNKNEKTLIIDVEKNKSPQEKIILNNLKINALNKLMITTSKP